jgi:hypothetical protein
MECRLCGRSTAIVLGGVPICEGCYESAGSCCLEFGGEDLWQKREQESRSEVGQPDLSARDDGGKADGPGG